MKDKIQAFVKEHREALMTGTVIVGVMGLVIMNLHLKLISAQYAAKK